MYAAMLAGGGLQSEFHVWSMRQTGLLLGDGTGSALTTAIAAYADPKIWSSGPRIPAPLWKEGNFDAS